MTSCKPLTRRQRQCLRLLALHLDAYGYAPTVEWLDEFMGARRRSISWRLLLSLRERGLVAWCRGDYAGLRLTQAGRTLVLEF